MAAMINAEQVIQRLQALHRQHALVPMLGSGLSAGACREWRDLIPQLAKRANAPETAALTAAAEKGDRHALNRLADVAAQRLQSTGQDAFLQACTEAVYNNAQAQEQLPSAVQCLASVPWPLVLSANYDDFYLQAVCAQEKTPLLLGRTLADCRQICHSLDLQVRPIVWAVQGLLTPRTEPVRKLFAKKAADLCDEIIVSDWQFQKSMSSDSHFRSAFAEVFRTRSLLLVGCSLAQNYLSNLFAQTARDLGGNGRPHFALFAEHTDVDEDFLSRLNLSVIRYSDPQKDNAGLAAALEELTSALSANRMAATGGYVSEISYSLNQGRTVTISMRPRQSQPSTILSVNDVERLLTTSSNLIEDIDFSALADSGDAQHPLFKFVRFVKQLARIYHPGFEKSLLSLPQEQAADSVIGGTEVPVLTVRVDPGAEPGSTGFGIPKLVPGLDRRVVAGDPAAPIPIPTVRMEQSDDDLPMLKPTVEHRSLKLPGQQDSQPLPTLKLPSDRDSRFAPLLRMPSDRDTQPMPILQMPSQDQSQPLQMPSEYDTFPSSDPISVPTVRVEQDATMVPKLVAGFEHRVMNEPQKKIRTEHSLPDLIVHLEDPDVIALLIAGKIDVSELLLCTDVPFTAEAHYLSGSVDQATFVLPFSTTIASVCESFALDANTQDWQVDVFPQPQAQEKPLTVAQAFEMSLEQLSVLPKSRVVFTQRPRSGWLSKLAKGSGRL